MIKFIVVILSFGLSTLLTLLLSFNEAWKIAVGIVGFGLAFFLVFVLIFFGVIAFFNLRIKKDETPIKYSSVYRKVYNAYQAMLLSLFSVKLTVNGINKVPEDTNFILFQNHRSNVDPIFTDYVLRKHPMIFVSKESLFRNPVFGNVIRHIGYVKLTRKAGMEDQKELTRGLRWVRAEECSLAVYPEGTRNKTFPNPKLLELKSGTIDFAMSSGRPIVISTIHGTEKINEKLLFKIHKIQIDIIGVIKPEEYAKLTPVELTEKVSNMMLDGIDNPLKDKEKVRLF